MPNTHTREDREFLSGTLEPVAVIGLSLKFPQDAVSPESFWKLMAEKRCAMTEFPSDRLNIDAFYHPDSDRRNTFTTRGGHFLAEDLGAFDADFFSVTPSEAAAMDPAQRGLLETAYRAFENAGLSIESISGSRTSVHTGCFTDDYKTQLLRDPDLLPKYASIGIEMAILANRLSWFYNLLGPSVNIDSACSSSSMAVDQACQLLRSRDCSMALVAGCNIVFMPDFMKILTNMGFLSPDSRCYAFDHRANGYARGEGFGIVILKLLSEAVRDNDTIRAVIRSAGTNQDGHTPGITQPSSKAQERLIRDTYAKAGLSMQHTRFFEAHGTGTAVGDPIEAEAIGSAFRDHRSSDDPLYVGAVKSNIGHLEAASGIAGLIKTILILEKGIIPPNTNFEKINHMIDADFLHIRLPMTCIPWPGNGLRRASINSFGFGGTNAHLIVDDAFNYLQLHNITANHRTLPHPPQNLDGDLRVSQSLPDQDMCTGLTFRTPNFELPRLLVWSAADEAGLTRLATLFQAHFRGLPKSVLGSKSYLYNLAYTLDSRRSRLPCKSYMIIQATHDLENVQAKLSSPVRSRVASPRLGFIFTGQGAQWHAMGRELLQYPVFMKSLEDSNACLGRLGCQWSIVAELCKSQSKTNVNDAAFSQPLCTALQIALVDLLRSFRVSPTAVVGHSSGEIAAAYCIGAISQESALKVAFYRGMLAGSIWKKSTEDGAMMSVGLPAIQAEQYLKRLSTEPTTLGLTVSCINSPTNVTISGEACLVEKLESLLVKEGVFARRLPVKVAYHSNQMKLVSDEYGSLLGQIPTGDSDESVVMISSVTGLRVTSEDLCKPEYWANNMVSPVLFSRALQELCSRSRKDLTKKIDRSHRHYAVVDHLVEIGPHAALQSSVRECLKKSSRGSEIDYSHVLRRDVSASVTLMDFIGQVHSMGVHVDLRRVNEPYDSNPPPRTVLVDLPEYAFNHTQRYWHESRLSIDYRLRTHSHNELLGIRSADWNPLDARWRNFLRPSEMPWIEDHKINGVSLYPGAGMLAMAIEAASQLADPKQRVTSFELRKIAFENALDVSSDSDGLEVQLTLRGPKPNTSYSGTWSEFAVYSVLDKKWTLHCNGLIQTHYGDPDVLVESSAARDGLVSHEKLWKRKSISCTQPADSESIYRFLQQRGLNYGPCFQAMDSLYYNDKHGKKEVTATVKLFDTRENEPRAHQYIIHPVTLDAILHTMFPALSCGGTLPMSTCIPQSIERLWLSKEGLFYDKTNDAVDVFAGISSETTKNATASFMAFSEDKSKLLLIADALKTVSIATTTPQVDPSLHNHQIWLKLHTGVDVDILDSDETSNWLSYMRSVSKASTFDTYLESLIFKFPHLKILETNAESDSLRETLHELVNRHRSQSNSRSIHYDSKYQSAQLNGGSAILDRDGKPANDSKLLDYGKSSAIQGYEEGIYDLIIHNHSSQIANDVSATLVNVSKYLEPCGRIIVKLPRSAYGKDCTPGSKDALTICPMVLLAAWTESLQANNFTKPKLLTDTLISGEDIAFVSSARPSLDQEASSPLHPMIIVDLELDSLHRMADGLAKELFSLGLPNPELFTLQQAATVPNLRNYLCIVMVELERPFLPGLNDKDYAALKSVLLSTSQMLWITRGGGFYNRDPGFGTVDGFGRAMRLELNDLKLVTVALELTESASHKQVKALVKIIRQSFQYTQTGDYEREFVEVDGRLNIRRVVEAHDLKVRMLERISMKKISHVSIRDARSISLNIQMPGQLDTLEFVVDDPQNPSLQPIEVEIRVQAVSLDFSDFLVATGMHSGTQFGRQCAGIVERAGSASSLRIGDRVCALGTGFMKSLTISHKSFVAKIPDTTSLQQASVLLGDYLMAYHVLHRVGRIRKGDSVLIHRGIEPISQALIRMCLEFGAITYTLVQTQEEKQTLRGRCCIPDQHIFIYSSFTRPINSWTEGQVVSTAIYPKGDHAMPRSWEYIAPYGHAIYIKHPGDSLMTFPDVPSNLTLSTADYCSILEAESSNISVPLQQIVDVATKNADIPPVALSCYLPSQIQDAFRQLKHTDESVKTVVLMDDDDVVPVVSKQKPSYEFERNATYVIAGGLGGLGRSLAQWMVHRGATHLILLSRSGPRTDAARQMLACMADCDVRVETPLCDVTDLSALQKVIQSYAATLPPIKGCIQASMVAKDVIYEKMTFEDWRTVIEPKCQGSWNLHYVLPKGMQFFIMTSSISSIMGHISQVNYSAGNTFQDALAKYRIGQGEKAASLDLGLIAEVGFLTEQTDLFDRLDRTGYYLPLSQAEVLAIFDHYCDPNLGLLSPEQAQPIVGIKTPKSILQQGSDLPPTMRQPLWSHLHVPANEIPDGTPQSADQTVSAATLVANTKSAAEVGDILVEAFVKHVSRMLSVPPDRIDKDSPIHSYGVDSLTAVDLRNWIKKTFNAEVPVFDILGGASFTTLALVAAKQLRP